MIFIELNWRTIGAALSKNAVHFGTSVRCNLKNVWSCVFSHLQHVLQVAAQLHVHLSSSHGQEAQGQLHSGQGLTHIIIRLQLLSQCGLA